MNESDLYIEVPGDDTDGHAIGGVVAGGDEDWIRDRLGRGGRSSVVMRPGDDGGDDVEGHATGSRLRLRAFDSEDDTEGHAISISFPSREEADAFRKRLMLAGVLTGTLILGAAGGAGLASMSGTSAEAGAGAGAPSADEVDRTQAERAPGPGGRTDLGPTPE